ncbi:circadian clock KaiB family protein [Thiobaca trueperi]|uniref:Circadian clock protein KaiB n=1 Tax=Thiobaca trueperi TaxID=127458 RepID=A0A4R3MRH5_9GAMM|nr:circadian clock protein KaiB [Thiobaca trueperi]
MTARTPRDETDSSGSVQRNDDRSNFEAAAQACGSAGYILRLYIASLTPRSMVAIRSVKEICEKHLQGRYELEIIDIYEHPTLAKGEQIVAAPTLIKELPLPLRRLIGDMADEQRVLVGLDLRARGTGSRG